MECRNVINALSDHVDGLLPESDAIVIEGHLTSCAPCRTIKLELNEIRIAARDLPLHTPSRGLWLRISNSLEAELALEEAATTAAPAKQSWWSRMQAKTFTFNVPQLAGAGTAALALLAFSSVSFYRQYNSVLTMRGMQAVALLPEEAEFRPELDRRMETIKARMVSWHPQRRDDFEQQMKRIEASLQSCREYLQAHPNDSTHLAMIRDLYLEKRQLLEDVERLKW
jgi:hypothetical protein